MEGFVPSLTGGSPCDSCSDHCPVLIRLLSTPPRTRPVSRYEIMWERHRGLPDVVANSWVKHKPSGGLGSVAASLQHVMNDLKEIRKDTVRMPKLCAQVRIGQFWYALYEIR